MDSLVDAAVSARGIFACPKRLVKIAFPYIGFEAVDLLQRGVAIEGQTVRPESYHRTVSLVTSPELQMAVTFQCVVCLMEIRDLCQERPWVFCEWMQVYSVYDQDDQVKSYTSRKHN